ncbi:putative esterase [Rhodococcus wratislaviensis]|uniref:Putative esterase n=1 Tax=Rhodococcus wratislaviensis TaxID=44752 RepID=A0A402C7G3_RHOWR|nr:putative esterase [Rhodococcus wratislaviensis]
MFRRISHRQWWCGTAAASLVLGVIAAGGGVATADPVVDSGQALATAVAENGSKLDRIKVGKNGQLTLFVYSASMQRVVQVPVQRPADTSQPRPTLYILDGGTRRAKTDIVEFMSDKNVNVVSPIGGENAYWTDWKSPDPALGVNKWKTFMTEELPPIVDSALGTTGVNAIAGMSRVGTAALHLAIAAPGLFRGVAAYSGCAQTSDPLGQQFVKISMDEYGKGNPENMWGASNDPAWAENDPYVQAAAFRGVELFISSGNGLPGQYDTLDGPHVDGKVDVLARQVVGGGIIEAATNYCTHRFADRLGELGIPATVSLRDSGTHSWGYWQDDLHDSWPVLAKALEI